MTQDQKDFLKAQKEEKRNQAIAHAKYVENLRVTVNQLELEARYSKAQFEKMHFALEAEQLLEPYNQMQSREREKMEAVRRQQQEFLEKMNANKAEGDNTPDPTADIEQEAPIAETSQIEA